MKRLNSVFLGMLFATLLSACSLGAGTTTNPPTISASIVGTNNCTNMQNGSQCTIQLTYNLNGGTGLALNYTPQPTSPCIAYNGSLFNSSLSACQAQVNTANNQTTNYCVITVAYSTQSGACSTNVNLAFTLGSTTSNATNITGN